MPPTVSYLELVGEVARATHVTTKAGAHKTTLRLARALGVAVLVARVEAKMHRRRAICEPNHNVGNCGCAARLVGRLGAPRRRLDCKGEACESCTTRATHTSIVPRLSAASQLVQPY